MRFSWNFFCCLLVPVVLSLGCGQKPSPTPPANPPPMAQPNQPVAVPPQAQEQPKSLVQNIRAAALRPERQNELRQIGLFFRNFEIENNRNPRTDQEFIQYIQRDTPGIAKAIQEQYYLLNLRVNMKGTSTGVIAWEKLTDGPGHLVVRVDTSVSIMPVTELKKALAGP